MTAFLLGYGARSAPSKRLVTKDFDSADSRKHIRETVYRILQEALSNVSRHAEANHVAVELSDGGKSFTLSIRDDGVGFDREAGSPEGSLGLVSMAERARICGGDLEIQSAPEMGTTVRATLPKRSKTES